MVTIQLLLMELVKLILVMSRRWEERIIVGRRHATAASAARQTTNNTATLATASPLLYHVIQVVVLATLVHVTFTHWSLSAAPWQIRCRCHSLRQIHVLAQTGTVNENRWDGYNQCKDEYHYRDNNRLVDRVENSRFRVWCFLFSKIIIIKIQWSFFFYKL
jgi:hypothetical protein